MAKQVEPIKARAQILRLFNQPNLRDRRVEILTDLIQSLMATPFAIEEENTRLKKELDCYKKAAGAAVRQYVNGQMKEHFNAKQEQAVFSAVSQSVDPIPLSL